MKGILNRFRQNGSMNGGITNSTAYILAKLMRLPNLIIASITLYVVTKYAIHPPLIEHGIAPSLTNKEYYLLIFIMMCIAAGGYVHNDVIDQKTDQTNEKRKIIGHSISKHIGLILFIFLSFSPLLVAYSLVMEIDKPVYISYYLMLVFIFYIYNKYLQKMILVGNITVAILCACTVLLPYGLEIDAMNTLHLTDAEAHGFILSRLIAFSAFCFIANFIREVIKDLEDIEGDVSANYHTLPIAIGDNKAVAVIRSLTFMLLFGLVIWSSFNLAFSSVHDIVGIILLVTPLIYIITKTNKSIDNLDYGHLSRSWKLYLLAGIISFVLII